MTTPEGTENPNPYVYNEGGVTASTAAIANATRNNEDATVQFIAPSEPVARNDAALKRKKRSPVAQCVCVTIFLLLAAEIFGVFMDALDCANVAFQIGETAYDELGCFGWSELDITTLTSNDYEGDTYFKYSKVCDDATIIELTEVEINWCNLEQKGKDWHYGCYYRIGAGSFLVILYIIMLRRYRNWRQRNLMIDEINAQKYFVKINQSLLYLSHLAMLFWAVWSIYSIYNWTNDNVINKFDNFSTDVSLDIVYGIAAIVVLLLFTMLVRHFCPNC